MTQKELKRLLAAYKKSKLKESRTDRAAGSCYRLNTLDNDYNWPDQLAYISFVRGYELAMKEAAKMFAKGSWTKVPIDIDGSDPHLCANACNWHKENHGKRTFI
jgi:hypothetical protein